MIWSFDVLSKLQSPLCSARIIQALHLALGTDGESNLSIVESFAQSMLQAKESVSEMVTGSESRVNEKVDEIESHLQESINKQCPKSDTKEKEDEQWKGMLRSSAKFKEAKEEAAKRGVGPEAVEDILDLLVAELKGLSQGDEMSDAIKDSMKASLVDSKLMQDIKEKVNANEDKIITEAAARFFKSSLNEKGSDRNLQVFETGFEYLGQQCRNSGTALKDLLIGKNHLLLLPKRLCIILD